MKSIFSFGFLGIFFAIIIYVAEYSCSRFGNLCVLSPSPAFENAKFDLENADSTTEFSSPLAEQVSSIDVEVRNNLLGTEKTYVFVVDTEDGNRPVDSISGIKGTPVIWRQGDGKAIVFSGATEAEFAELILFVATEQLQKRTFRLSCRQYDASLRILNATYDRQAKELKVDFSGGCAGAERPVLNGMENEDAFPGQSWVIQLDSELFVDRVTTPSALKEEVARASRSVSDTQRFEECKANGSEQIRKSLPSVKQGVLYCWFYSEPPRRNQGQVVSGGFQTIAALHVTNDGDTLLLEREFYARSDSALFYPEDGLGPGVAFAAGHDTAIVGRLSTLLDELELVIANKSYFASFDIRAKSGTLQPGRNTRFDSGTRKLILPLMAGTEEIQVGDRLIRMNEGRQYILEILFDENGDITAVKSD